MAEGISRDIEFGKVAGMTGLAARAGKIVTGAKLCEDAAARGKVLLILMPEDAAENTSASLKRVCERNEVPLLVFGRMDTLGKIAGKPGIAALGVTDRNFASRIMELYKLL